MNNAHSFVLRVICILGCLFLLNGCNTVRPYLNVYDGLLPAGHQVKDSPDPMGGDLKGKTVVIVTTTNFNNEVTTWQNYYEKGGSEQQKEMLRGAATALSLVGPLANVGSGISSGVDAAHSAGDRYAQASDPRNVARRVVYTLQPHFKSIKIASDFAEAQQLKADYIALIDYYTTWNEMGDMYRTRGGIYMMDGSLRSVFKAEGKAEIDRDDETGGVLGGVNGMVNGTIRTLAKGLDITTTQMMGIVRTRLGPASRY